MKQKLQEPKNENDKSRKFAYLNNESKYKGTSKISLKTNEKYYDRVTNTKIPREQDQRNQIVPTKKISALKATNGMQIEYFQIT